MALVGGGGAGNVAGSNPAGTGTQLNYIGRDPTHAYAYSGVIAVPQATTTLLEFQVGAEYVRGILAIQNGSGSGDDISYEVLLNSEVIVTTRVETTDENDQFPLHLIFPPYSKVQVTAYNISSGAGRDHTAIFEGRVYA